MPKRIRFKKENIDSWVDAYWPVGSIYLTVTNQNPGEHFGGTWEKISTGRVLMGASSDSQLGTTVDSGLPNITAKTRLTWSDTSGQGIILGSPSEGSFFTSWSGAENWWSGPNNFGGTRDDCLNLDASRSSAIYGRSSIVQPLAFYCYIWKRVS